MPACTAMRETGQLSNCTWTTPDRAAIGDASCLCGKGALISIPRIRRTKRAQHLTDFRLYTHEDMTDLSTASRAPFLRHHLGGQTTGQLEVFKTSKMGAGPHYFIGAQSGHLAPGDLLCGTRHSGIQTCPLLADSGCATCPVPKTSSQWTEPRDGRSRAVIQTHHGVRHSLNT